MILLGEISFILTFSFVSFHINKKVAMLDVNIQSLTKHDGHAHSMPVH